jgi:diacylglycerol O-acyltransferase
VFPVVPLMGNIPLGIGALSYAGQFNITVVADRDGCPDAEIFTAALRTSLADLAKPVPVPS